MKDFKANKCFLKHGPTSLAKKVDLSLCIVMQEI